MGLADSRNRDSVIGRSKYRTSGNEGIRARIDRLPGAFTILFAIDLDDRTETARVTKMIGTGVGEAGEVALRPYDHQMHIKRCPRPTSGRLDIPRPSRDVRHESNIHRVDMDPVGSRRIDGASLLGEAPGLRPEGRRGGDRALR